MFPIKKSSPSLIRTPETIKDPLFRFFERELTSGLELKRLVQIDITDVIEVCEGRKKPTNYHRSLMSDLSKGVNYFISKIFYCVQK